MFEQEGNFWNCDLLVVELWCFQDKIAALNAEMEEMQLSITERNKLTTELHALKERRISLGELSAQTSHLRETLSKHRDELTRISERHNEIVRNELPRARQELNEAKNSRDASERLAKEHEERKLSAVREICNHYSAYITLKERLSKASLAAKEGQVDNLRRLISERDQSIIDLEKRKAGFEMGINDLEGTHVKRRTLEDQLTRMLIESKIVSVEKELNDLVWNAEEKEALCRNRDKAVRDRDRSGLEKARLNGQLEEVEKKITEAKLALSAKEMKQAESLYHEVMVDKIVTQEMITDLEKYMQCLDTSIIQFHTDKMAAINRILDDLWRKVYDGTDITTIHIKSECVASSEKRKAYDYRVVMVLRNGVELDMRDRCSAGQKMLACILIRIALADVFGGMCSIIALDEPTTNLDAAKVRGL
ncbi:hypothetical protein Y032_0020g109 [Ancylostoma ceylanicum]|uniref:RecF/RecN/SMC N-terminal domain-containing protein n=1 Tax=Ancylostoma ceylanicum TaxID=53326 RepID=A0A016V0S7_9BILA|nr:hypothetical protein Y032_0020g109 [Ancylostoma ceylanicum]